MQTVHYELCEAINPTNCKVETVTVTITPSISLAKVASSSSFTVGAPGQYYDITVTVASGPTTAAINITDSLPTGITLSGAPTKEAGSSSNGVLSGCPATGNTLTGCTIATNASSGTIIIRVPVTVGASATSGQNTATATGGGDPACTGTGTCTVTTPPVGVGSNAIVTTPDSGSIGGVAGGTVEANIVGDDTIAGNPATLGGSGNATVKKDPASPAWPSYLQLNTATGAVTVDPASPAGVQTVHYELCEAINPTNCKVETVTVTVNAAILSATNDAGNASGVTGGTAVANVAANDSLNGAAPTLGVSGNATVVTTGTWPTGLSLDANTGAVVVAPGTPAGIHTVQYTVCEKLNPSNCKTADVVVTVDAGTIKANPETGSAPNIGGTAISNVFANDTLNGSMVNVGDINATVTAPAAPQAPGASVPVLNPATGVVTVPPGTPVGQYTITYQICEKLNTANCSSAPVTVDVTNGTIAANPDVGSVFSVAGGVAVSNVAVNDSIKGVAANLGGNVQVSVSGVWPSAFALNLTTGEVSVAPNTAAGVYTLPYRLCELANASNCAQSTVTVSVKPSALQAQPDSATVPSVTGGVAVPNVAANDAVGGNPAVIGVNATAVPDPANPWPGNIHLDPTTGQVTVDAGTPSGVYAQQYQLCEKLNPSNCTTAAVTITVSAGTINAQPDSGTVPPAGGVAVPTVVGNDLINGNPVTLGGNGSISTSATWPSGIHLNTGTGEVTVDPNTPAGSYPLAYQVCELPSGTNCATATVTVTVTTGAKGQISGKAYFDRDRNRVFGGTDSPLDGYIAVLSRNVAGAVTELAQTQTASDGSYVFAGVEAGAGYQVSFRTPAMGPILGTPFNQAPQTAGGQLSTGQNQLITPTTGSVAFGAAITNVTVYSGDNTVEQNLPLDPSGVVYDSVTRQPITGATVTIVGPAGFNSALHLVGGAASATYVTVADGLYQFLLLPTAPTGIYTLQVQNPASYLPPVATAGGVAPAQGVLPVGPGVNHMQAQSTAPGVGVNGLPGTRYYLQLNFASFAGAPEVVNNHIPLDPLNVNGRLQVAKTASTNSVEVGDSLHYTIRVKNNGTSPVNGLTITDEPPMGFSLIDGTTVLQIGASKQGVVPVRLPGQRSFTVTVPGVVALGQEVTLTYYMRAGVGAAQGGGTNTVRVGLPGQPNLASDKVTVRVKGGVLGNDACLIGKVYVDSDGDRMQNNTPENVELGVPGVRLVMETGAYAITDAEGKYSICPVTPKTHVLRVDKKTLPAQGCSGLVPSSNQNAGDGSSIFADVKNGELHRADFILAGCSPAALDAVKARRSAMPEADLQLGQEQSATPVSSNLPSTPSAVLSSPASTTAPRAQ